MDKGESETLPQEAGRWGRAFGSGVIPCLPVFVPGLGEFGLKSFHPCEKNTGT